MTCTCVSFVVFSCFLSVHFIGDGKWFKFNEEIVTHANFSVIKEVVNQRLAASKKQTPIIFVYIRDSELEKVLEEVGDSDCPKTLQHRFAQEEHLARENSRMRKEAHLYMFIKVVVEENFKNHQGYDLFNPERTCYHDFRMLKASTFAQLLEVIAEKFKRTKEQVRGWPVDFRSNGTFRPNIQEDTGQSVWDTANHQNPWTLFVELTPCDSLDPLPPFDPEKERLMFFKYFDREEGKLRYCGRTYLSIESNLESLYPLLNERAGLPADTKLKLYEEVRPYMVEEIENLTDPIKDAIDESMSGDIIVFEKDEPGARTCIDYYKEIDNKLEITFINKSILNDLGFTLTLSLRMKYDEFATAVAEKLNTKPHLLQLFTHQNLKRLDHGLIKSNYTGTLQQLIHPQYRRGEKQIKLYYQQLNE